MTKKDAMRAAVEALEDTAQSLAWLSFGECRGFSERLLTSNDALAKARSALSLLRSALEEGEDGDYYSEEAADIAESKARKEASAWWALVMGAAASIEDAANCLRDPDAKKQADGAAKHYRKAAEKLMMRSPTTDKDAK